MKVTPVEGYYVYAKRDEINEYIKFNIIKLFKKESKDNRQSAEKSKERDTEGHFDCYQ